MGHAHFLTGLGGTHVMLPRFDAAEVLRLVEREHVTRLFLVPTMARPLLDHPDIATATSSRVHQVSHRRRRRRPRAAGRGRGRVRVRGHLRLRHDRVVAHAHPLLDKPGDAGSRAQRATTGLPILGVDLRVLDDDDVEVPWDGTAVGEICARSNHVMIGYWERPEETEAALRGGGSAPATSPSSTPTAT